MTVRRLTTVVVCTGVLGAAVVGAQGTAGATGGHDRHSAAAPRATKVTGWTQLSAGGVGTSLSEPSLLQTGSGAQVIWYQDDGSKDSIRSRLVSGTGKTRGGVVNVVTGWNGLIDDPKIIDHGGERMVVFAGIPPNLGSPLNGPLIYATSSKGTSWVVNTSNSLSETKYAYASYGTAALDNGGSPFVGVFASSSTYMTLHDGISPGIPASSGDFTTTQGLGCCAYNAGLGKDAASGAIWALWYSNASANGQNGVLAQRVSPTLGSWVQAPGSSIKGNSLDPSQGIAVASRRGGEVWAAYKVGYPTANRIRLWHVGTKEGFLVRAKDVRRVTLTAGLNGRLWLAWSDGRPRIHVTRTNTAVTRVGAVRTLKPPTRRGQYPTVYSLGATGLGGALHLAIDATTGTADPSIWYQRVPPGLLVSASPARLDKGKVTVKVTDAGAPVGGAKVSFLGSAKKTRGNGVAVFRVGGGVHPGGYLVTAFKRGYAKGSDRVRVT